MSDNRARLWEMKAGTKIRIGKDWGCIPDGALVCVEVDKSGDPFVKCAKGRHYLGGQIGEDGYLENMDLVRDLEGTGNG